MFRGGGAWFPRHTDFPLQLVSPFSLNSSNVYIQSMFLAPFHAVYECTCKPIRFLNSLRKTRSLFNAMRLIHG